MWVSRRRQRVEQRPVPDTDPIRSDRNGMDSTEETGKEGGCAGGDERSKVACRAASPILSVNSAQRGENSRRCENSKEHLQPGAGSALICVPPNKTLEYVVLVVSCKQ